MYLLPTPLRLTPAAGAFTLDLNTHIVLPAAPSNLFRTAAAQLQGEIRSACGLDTRILSGASRAGDIALAVDATLPAASYTLCIVPDAVKIMGHDEAALLHGAQTLRQIIRQSGWALPALTIEDAPSYPARGFYHDVTRGRTPTLAWLRQLADEACFYKLNQLQLYVEHTYLFRDMTEMSLAGTPLTAEDILELDAYCADRGIELVPSLSSFGHLFELLHTKSWCHLCELPDSEKMPSTMCNRMAHHTINAADPRSFELVRSLIEEFMPLFRSDKFNICSDETFDLGRGRNRERMAEIGEKELYMGFVRQLCELVAAHGKTPMFWGDIVLKFPEALEMLPAGTICLNWGYDDDITPDRVRKLAQHGARQYVCPGTNGWNRFVNPLRYSYENIRRMATYGREVGAIGLLNTDWGDMGHVNDPRFFIPGLIYGAQFSWSDRELSVEELNEAISHLTYMDRSGRVASILADIEDCELHRWLTLVHYGERIDELTPEYLEKRRNTRRFQTVEAANAALDEMKARLMACARDMDSTQRHLVQCWLVAVEGIAAWNAAGEAVTLGQKDPATAQRLERWFLRFEAMWLEVSQPSELWRTREMVRFYATHLLR